MICARALLAVAALAAVVGCGGENKKGAQARLMEGLTGQGEDIESACRLTAQRCTRCHDIERVLYVRVRDPLHWQHYVERMRRMPGSGISEEEGDIILRCVVYRSFGHRGLWILDTRAGDGDSLP